MDGLKKRDEAIEVSDVPVDPSSWPPDLTLSWLWARGADTEVTAHGPTPALPGLSISSSHLGLMAIGPQGPDMSSLKFYGASCT